MYHKADSVVFFVHILPSCLVKCCFYSVAELLLTCFLCFHGKYTNTDTLIGSEIFLHRRGEHDFLCFLWNNLIWTTLHKSRGWCKMNRSRTKSQHLSVSTSFCCRQSCTSLKYSHTHTHALWSHLKNRGGVVSFEGLPDDDDEDDEDQRQHHTQHTHPLTGLPLQNTHHRSATV